MIKFSILLIALTLVCSSNVPTESNDIASCIAAITVLPKDIMSVIEAVKEFDIAKTITAVTALVDDGKKAYSECLGKKEMNLSANWYAFEKCIASSRRCSVGQSIIFDHLHKFQYGDAIRVFAQYFDCWAHCQKYL